MIETTTSAQPKVKYKTFTYNTNLKWVGGKAGIINSLGKPEFRVASPPEFKGEDGVWTPEDLFVAAVNICTMTTFLAFANRKEIPIDTYESHAEGVLEFVDGSYRFTKVMLKPKIRLRNPDQIEIAEKILHDAHQKCLIANSINSVVVLEPNFEGEIEDITE